MIHGLFYDHNSIKLEVNNKKRPQKIRTATILYQNVFLKNLKSIDSTQEIKMNFLIARK